MTPLAAPTLGDVLDARRAIAPYLRRTPLHHYPLLDELVGTQVYVSRLDPDARSRGVFAASTGNHGQSVA